MQSDNVMTVILEFTGHNGLQLAHDLAAIEHALENTLASVRALRTAQ